MTKRFLVRPGWVQSINDGEWHYITARQLMDLYRVHPSECVILDFGPRQQFSTRSMLGYTDAYLKTLLPLKPMKAHYIPVSDLERKHWPDGAYDPKAELEAEKIWEAIVNEYESLPDFNAGL